MKPTTQERPRAMLALQMLAQINQRKELRMKGFEVELKIRSSLIMQDQLEPLLVGGEGYSFAELGVGLRSEALHTLATGPCAVPFD